MLRVIETPSKENDELRETLDEVLQRGALKMLQQVLEAEVEAYITRHRAARDERGRAQVVRNGKAPARQLVTGSGTLQVRAPRVNDRRVDTNGERRRFTSEILPSYMRRAPKVTEVLPILYLRGLSTGDFQAALPVLLGEDAAGLSPTTITRLTASWEGEYQTWRSRSLADTDYVYVWVDGVHFRVRLEEDRLCTLVMIGVRPDGTKELLAVEDGYRESTDSWATVLRDLKRRGLRAPLVAVGDSALGFWAAVGAVWAETREQRCWVHRIANVLDKLPKRLQPKAKQALHAIMNAPTRAEAEAGIDAFAVEYDAKYPKAVGSLRRRPGAAPHLLRFPGGALAPSAHDQHYRVPLCDRAAAPARDEGGRLTHEGAHDGLQAARDGGRALAKGEWIRAAASGARRCPLRRRRPGESEHQSRRGEGDRRLSHVTIHNI
jgi:putative transposase